MHWTFPCSYPVDFQVKEPEELVTKRCIDGALSILKTWLNSKTVKRVVYTTSVGAVICNGKEDQKGCNHALNLAFGDKDPLAFNARIPMVHVEDVVRAHIFLLEHPDPKGSALKQNKGIRVPDLSAKKLIDDGFMFKYGLEEMLDDAVQCCKEKGYL
ncbi:Dihydroflavonol-4-reductase [Glycine soja]|nr:Dihydroflavonol-4-reductase [Glycine soja]